MNELVAVLLTGIIVATLVTGLIYLGVKSAEKDHKRRDEEFQAKVDKFLAEQVREPKYVIRFTANGVNMMTDPFAPVTKRGYRDNLYTWTSEEVAQARLKEWYERGYFEGHDGQTYPIRTITSAKVMVF